MQNVMESKRGDAEPAIAADSLGKRFGDTAVFSGLHIEVDAGQVLGLVGLNGAGKTTLIRLLLGLLQPTSGTFAVLGRTPHNERLFYRDIGVVLENNGFYGNLTVEQNVSLFAEAKGLGRDEWKRYFHEWWRGSAIDEPGKKSKLFSRGQKMQCALCRAFLGWPRALFLDEPAVALDVNAYDHFCGLVRHARDTGAAVLISSHQLDAIEDLCDNVGVLEGGALQYLDTAHNAEVDTWALRCSATPRCERIISEVSVGTPRLRDGVWRFTLHRHHRERIPGMVRKLVNDGCDIWELHPLEPNVRESIRRYYGNGGGAGKEPGA